jgi:hypothetical protein
VTLFIGSGQLTGKVIGFETPGGELHRIDASQKSSFPALRNNFVQGVCCGWSA